MDRQLLFVVVSSVVNVVLLLFAVFVFLGGVGFGLFLLLFPLVVGLLVFLVVRFVKRFGWLRSLKYFNVVYFGAYLIPVGVILFYAFVRPGPVGQPLYGVYMDPFFDVCVAECRELANETKEVVAACLERCRR